MKGRACGPPCLLPFLPRWSSGKNASSCRGWEPTLHRGRVLVPQAPWRLEALSPPNRACSRPARPTLLPSLLPTACAHHAFKAPQGSCSFKKPTKAVGPQRFLWTLSACHAGSRSVTQYFSSPGHVHKFPAPISPGGCKTLFLFIFSPSPGKCQGKSPERHPGGSEMRYFVSLCACCPDLGSECRH